MSHNNKIAVVFGGTGFVGRQVVRELAALGLRIRVATRVPERAYFLKPSGAVGQIVPVQCDYGRPESLAQAIKGADYVVNCVGILFEKGKKSTFQRVHVDYPALLAKLCSENGVQRLVHISALACDKGTSKYAKSKLAGEKAILSNFPKATILRPSVIFGEDDQFFNMFAEISRYTPVLPLIGGGRTKFQPVYVGDVADAVVKTLAAPQTEGKIYSLGGSEIMDFRQIYERLFKYTGRSRCMMKVPFSLAKVKASFMEFMPHPFLTRDQVESLKTDNIVEGGSLGFADLGISPKTMDLVLPAYLEYFKSGGRFAKGNKVVS